MSRGLSQKVQLRCRGGGGGGVVVFFFFFFKQKTAYEIGTGDWSSDVCSSDLHTFLNREPLEPSVPTQKNM